MPAALEPPERVKCTFKDCHQYFDSEKSMRSHKKYSEEHEYCSRCDEDFEDFDELAYHKIVQPAMHGKACRVCGDEFKSDSGLRRHIELNHKVDQKLVCIGCQQSFYRACLFVEHLEFGHCDVISASQFQGHIVHKFLVTELLNNNVALDRFQQKQAKYDATLDHEEEGGVSLGDDIFDDEKIDEVHQYKALEPECGSDMPLSPSAEGAYPTLPSQMKRNPTPHYDLVPGISQLSFAAESETSTVINSPVAATYTARSTSGGSVQASTVPSSNRQLKVWGSRDGKSASSKLVPDAKPTPAPSELSIAAHDDRMQKDGNLNIMKDRFWDPMSHDWNPDRFYDSVVTKFYCPFVCEQTFEIAADLNSHIMNDHRITRMKCPMCLKYFNSATALMSHCESRGASCQINKADDFNIFLDRLSGGFLGVNEITRPDHLNNPTVMVTNEETGRMERYKPPVASYMQYQVTTPPDWKDPVRTTKISGGFPTMGSKGSKW